jgi:hypothetical protein
MKKDENFNSGDDAPINAPDTQDDSESTFPDYPVDVDDSGTVNVTNDFADRREL